MSYKTLTKYLIKNIILSYSVIFIVLFLIVIGNQVLALFIKSQELGLDNLLEFIILKSLGSLPIILSLSLFLSILVALGALYKNNEITAMSIAGFGFRQLLFVVQLVSIPIAVLVALFYFYIEPNSIMQVEKMEHIASKSIKIKQFSARKFHRYLNNSVILYAQNIEPDTKKMQEVFLNLTNNNQSFIAYAKEGYIDYSYNGNTVLFLKHGSLYNGFLTHNIDAKKSIVNFINYKMILVKNEISQSFSSNNVRKNNVNAQHLGELLEAGNVDGHIIFYNKISKILSILILSILAIILSKSNLRQTGQTRNIIIGVIFFAIYHNLIPIAGQLMTDYGVNLLWVHLLVLIIIYLIYNKIYKLY